MPYKFTHFVCSFLWATLARAQPGFEPAPAEWLDGPRLVATDLNVSLVAPGSDWEWLISSDPAEEGPNGFQVLACRSPDGSRLFLVAVHNPFWGRLDADSAAQLAAGVRHGLEKAGLTVDEVTHERSNVPLPRSDRFTMGATLADGRELYTYGYSATRGRLFQFQHASAEPVEPQISGASSSPWSSWATSRSASRQR